MWSLFLIMTTELVLWVVCLNENHDFYSSEILLSQNKTTNTKVSTGIKLVNYTEILSSSFRPKIASLLEDGESAWISGYANFSSVVVEHGCLNKTRYHSNFDSYLLDIAGIDLCVRKCLRGNANVTYVGTEEKYCVCFDNKERNSLTTDVFVNSSFCSLRCTHFDISLCGGSNYMNLYKVINNNGIVWAKNQPGPQQCINVQIQNDTGKPRVSAYAASCFTFNKVRGYICKNSLLSTLDTDNCDKSISDRTHCLVKKKSTRLEAFDDCLNKYGTLAEYFGEQYSVNFMQDGRRYWSSAFRTFQPTQQNFSKGSVCLAVTKVSDKLYLEPGSCRTRKRYLYRQIKTPTRTDSDKHNFPLTAETAEPTSVSNKHSLTHTSLYTTSDPVTLKSIPGTNLKKETTFIVQTNTATTGFNGVESDILSPTSDVNEAHSVLSNDTSSPRTKLKIEPTFNVKTPNTSATGFSATLSDIVSLTSEVTETNLVSVKHWSSLKSSLKTEPTLNAKTSNKQTTGFFGVVPDKDILNATSEVTETHSVPIKHWSVTKDNKSSTDNNSVISSPNTTLNPVRTVSLEAANNRVKSYNYHNYPDSVSNKYDRMNTPSLGQDTVSHLRTVSINANKNVIGLDTNGTSMIVYILPSFLFLVLVIASVVFVIYLRKRKQFKLQSHTHTNTNTGHVLGADNDQNFRTNCIESSISNQYQNVGKIPENNGMKFDIQELQDDQIVFVEIKPKYGAETNMYDHALHGIDYRYSNTDDTCPPFMYSLAKDGKSLSSFKEVKQASNSKRKKRKTDSSNISTVNANSEQEVELHIYNVVTCTGEDSKIAL